MSRYVSALAALPLILMLTACGGGIVKEASYPTRPDGTDKIVYSDQKRETVWGDDESLGSKLLGRDKDKDAGGSGLGVNGFLWRAALDTIAFMPVASADPFGGVILTDWYENPKTPGERYKINVYILDRQLRADGIRVSVFKQARAQAAAAPAKKGKGKTAPAKVDDWRDVAVPADMATTIENTILTRARDMRVAQLGARKK